MEVYRITHKKWSGTLSASGYPARWNSEGIFMIYTAGSRALACLENVVHRGTSELTAPYTLMVISIPGELCINILEIKDLPSKWRQSDESGYLLCRPFGDQWINSMECAILKVPSAIVPGDVNFLLNPFHPDFKRIQILSEEPFVFDERIKMN